MPNSPVSTAYRFTTAGSLEHNPTALRQRASSALSTAPTGTTFVTRREGQMLAHYLVMPGEGHAEPIIAAKSIAARAEKSEAPDLSLNEAYAVLQMPANGVPGSNPQMNAEIAAVVDAASSSLRDGEWVAVSIRRPSQQEVVQHSKWLSQYGVHTHHSKEASAVLVSLWSGADTSAHAQDLLQQVAGALPGFDMPRYAQAVASGRVKFGFALGALLGAAYALVPQFVDVALPYPMLGYAVAGASCVGFVLAALDKLPSRAKRIRARMRSGLVPAPPRRIIPAAGAKTQKTDAEGNVTQVARNGAYPLSNEAFLVGAVTPLTVIAPHAGAQSGAGMTAQRSVPPQLFSAEGPLVGYSGDDQVHLTDDGDWRGLMALGAAGSGKSVLIQGIWGYDSMRKTGIVGRRRGKFNSMVAFDTKDGKSATAYVQWARDAGQPVIRTKEDFDAWNNSGRLAPPLVVIDMADQSATFGVELFPGAGDPVNRARRAVNALKYTFGATSIGPESFATLSRVLIGAFAVTPSVAAEAKVEVGRSAFYYAGLLLGTRGDELGSQLADALRSAGERDGDQNALDASGYLAPLYGPKVTPAQRRSLTSAPQNKMEQMLAAEQWWSRPTRPSWASLLEANASVVVNFGQSGGFLMDAEQREQLASLMLYTLHEEIKLTCVGWQDEGRSVSIYADELKHIAGNSPDVVNWARQDGRSFGVRLIVATQEPEQLEDSVRRTVMGLGTLVAFKQDDVDVIRQVIANIDIDGGGWEASDLRNLPQFHAIVRTHFDGQSLTPFTVRVAFFEGMRGDEFVRAQRSIASLEGTPVARAAAAAVESAPAPVADAAPEPNPVGDAAAFAVFDPDAQPADLPPTLPGMYEQ